MGADLIRTSQETVGLFFIKRINGIQKFVGNIFLLLVHKSYTSGKSFALFDLALLFIS